MHISFRLLPDWSFSPLLINTFFTYSLHILPSVIPLARSLEPFLCLLPIAQVWNLSVSPPFKEIFQPSVLLSCSFSHRPGRSAWSRADAQYTLNNDRILLFFLIPNSSRAHTYSLHLLPSFLSRFCSLPPPVSPDLLSRRSETAEDLPHLRACNFVLSLLSRLQGSAPSPSPSTLISYLEIRILFFFFFWIKTLYFLPFHLPPKWSKCFSKVL